MHYNREIILDKYSKNEYYDPENRKEEEALEDLDLIALKRIGELMEARGWSLPELARRSGLSLSTLRSARNRGSRICLENLKRICDAFGMGLGEFVDSL